MENIVLIDGERVFTNTKIIAEGVGLEHNAIMIMVRKYKNDLNEIGSSQIQFEKFKTKGRDGELAELDEIQSTFLITLMRNSKIVVEFKKAVTVEFFNMRNRIDSQNSILDAFGYMDALNVIGKQKLKADAAGSQWGKAGSDIKKVKKILEDKELALNSIMQLTLKLQSEVEKAGEFQKVLDNFAA